MTSYTRIADAKQLDVEIDDLEARGMVVTFVVPHSWYDTGRVTVR